MSGGTCFAAGTLVWTDWQDSTGAWHDVPLPIEQVKQGVVVPARNEQTGKTEYKRVLQTSVRQVDVVVAVTLAPAKTGHAQETITATREHPFYVKGKGFVPAGALAIGNSIVTRAGPALVVKAVKWLRRPEGYKVYNFVVDDLHTYFVGNTNGGVWVHNPQAYEVGDYNSIKGAPGNQAHHLPQAHVAEQAIPGYVRESGLAVNMPAADHAALPFTSRLRGNFSTLTPSELRAIISQQLRDAANANVPAATLRELAREIRRRYPSIFQ